jgi:TonB family protein
MKVNVRLLALPALVIALSAEPTLADSQADVARELERARTLTLSGDQRNACQAYSRANELAGGKSSPSLIGVADCYKQIKDEEKALATARQALAVAVTSEERTHATFAVGNALFRRTDEKAWTEALDLFKGELARSNGASGGEGLLSALLLLHRDLEAKEFLQSLRQQGKSTEEILPLWCRVHLGDSSNDAQRIDARNTRVRQFDPEAPMQIGGKVGRPELLHTTDAQIPSEARKHPGFRGTVALQAVIDAQGRVRGTKVLQEQPYGLTESAMTAVRTWTYKPLTLDGVAVPVCHVLTVSFVVR